MQRKMQSKQVCCITANLNPGPIWLVIHVRPSEQASLPATVHMPQNCIVQRHFSSRGVSACRYTFEYPASWKNDVVNKVCSALPGVWLLAQSKGASVDIC